ncbi:major facilitator superfamily domain-containing protein 12-like isoform X2 [Artemia franciscana]|uniref:major facilitator superfamily domain-containing protein 12-like isoform X2 n=1 Tax=Artemia franciscana TaxID=6661 RepID=UPI0032DA2B0D
MEWQHHLWEYKLGASFHLFVLKIDVKDGICLPCLGCQDSHKWAQLIYYAAFVTIFQIGWAAVQISHLTLIPILAKDDRARTEITSYRYACTVISNITVYIITWTAFGLSSSATSTISAENVDQFRKIVFIAVAIGATFSAIFFFGVKENRDVTNESQERTHSQEKQLKGILDWLKEWKFYKPCLGCQDSHKWAQLIYYAAFVTIFQIGWAAVQISHLTLIPILAKDDRARTEITSYRYACTVISNITVYIITWTAFELSSSATSTISAENVDQFRKIVFIAVAIGATFSAIFFFGVKENRDVTNESQERTHSQEKQLKGILDWLKEWKFYKVAILYMSTRLFVNLSQVYLPLYLQDTLNLPSTTLATVPLSFFVSGLFASLLIRPLRLILSKKVIFSIGVILGLVPSILIWYDSSEVYKQYGVYLVAILYGAAGSILLVMSLAITAALIGDNIGSGGFVYGAMSFTDKLSNGLAVFFIQSFHSTSLSPEAYHGYYKWILSVVCGSAAILGLLSATPNTLDKCRRGTVAVEVSENDREAEPLLRSLREENLLA